ncbi:MAG: hypothetical protein ACYT04_25785 [Nostoc sp.]
MNQPMPNTSLLRLRQRLLYETLRERYFDPSLRDATRTTGVTLSLSKGSGQASSVQVSTSAQCPPFTCNT